MPTKFALGTIPPTPVTVLVLVPSLLAMVTTLLKLPALGGAKRTTKFVEPNPGRLKGEPDMIAKAPALIVATPLDKGASPRLLNVKLAWVVAPTSTVAKFILVGDTDN